MNKRNREFVYIFVNFRYQGLVKVGKTKKQPETRADELSKATGVLGYFEAVWYIEVPDCTVGEKLAHERLKQYHFENEFYKIEVSRSIEIVQSCLTEHFGIENTRIFDKTSYTNYQSIFETTEEQFTLNFGKDEDDLKKEILNLKLENKRLNEKIKEITISGNAYFENLLEEIEHECATSIRKYLLRNDLEKTTSWGYLHLPNNNRLVDYIIEQDLPHQVELNEEEEIIAIKVPIPSSSYELKCVYAAKFRQMLAKIGIKCGYYIIET